MQSEQLLTPPTPPLQNGVVQDDERDDIEPLGIGVIPLILAILCPPIGLAVGIGCMMWMNRQQQNDSRSYQLAVGGIVISALILISVALLLVMFLGLIMPLLLRFSTALQALAVN